MQQAVGKKTLIFCGQIKTNFGLKKQDYLSVLKT